jgi:hypothetical protein
MPPKTQGTDVSVILNQLRQTATSAYQDTVPMASAKNIMDVGDAVLKAPQAIRNEFMNNLFNKIGLTLVEYPVVNNHLSFLRKGTLEYGQTIEDIYVGLATAEPYITGMSDGKYPDPFKIHKVPHLSSFYHTILSRQYPLTRHLTDLRKAFHGSTGMEAFIGGMMNAITSREAYDDYRMTVALMARQIEEATKSEKHKGRVKLLTLFNASVEESERLTPENAFHSMKFLQFYSNQLQKWSERLSYLREDLNIAGVPNITPASQQRIMMQGDILVDFKTQLLAWAYNSGNLEIGGVDKIDAWYTIGANAEGESGIVVTPEHIKTRATFTEEGVMCVGVIYDPGMPKIYNKEYIGSTQENAAGNYWNMFTSIEDIFAASPYKNFVYFTLD